MYLSKSTKNEDVTKDEHEDEDEDEASTAQGVGMRTNAPASWATLLSGPLFGLVLAKQTQVPCP